MNEEFILILDFGGCQVQSTARRLRSQNYYCEIQPCSMDAQAVRRKAPGGLIMVGDSWERKFDAEILQLGLPVLALGRCALGMAAAVGARPGGILLENTAAQITFRECPLFHGLEESDRFFERVDALDLPEGFEEIAVIEGGISPAFANIERRLYGLQFSMESNDPDGGRILGNFAGSICGCAPFWSPEFYIDREVQYIRERIGGGSAIMAVSGGVDSTVCAELMRRAIGDRLICVFVENGLLRKNEAEGVIRDFRENMDIDLIAVDAHERFLNALAGVEDPAEKRRIVHEQFISTFREEAARHPDVEFLVEGTIYSDLLGGYSAETAYAEHLAPLKRIEPIRMLFKDEVRFVGETLGVPKELLSRQPFPGEGLTVRCMGEVTEEKLNLLREADTIFCEEIVQAGLDRRLSQYFAVLTNIRTRGIRDGHKTVEYACVLRAVCSQSQANISVYKLPYDLLERVVTRIIREVPGINHVLYDVTGQPLEHAELE